MKKDLSCSDRTENWWCNVKYNFSSYPALYSRLQVDLLTAHKLTWSYWLSLVLINLVILPIKVALGPQLANDHYGLGPSAHSGKMYVQDRTVCSLTKWKKLICPPPGGFLSVFSHPAEDSPARWRQLRHSDGRREKESSLFVLEAKTGGPNRITEEGSQLL